MAHLTREKLLEAGRTLPQETVELPALGGTVIVRGLSSLERDDFEDSITVGRGKKQRVNVINARARLAVRTTIDEDGKPIFTEADVEALGSVRADMLDRIWEAASRLSGITEADVDELVAAAGKRKDAGST